MNDYWLPLLRGYKRPSRHPVRLGANGEVVLHIGKRFLQQLAKNFGRHPVPVLREFDHGQHLGWVREVRVTDGLVLEGRLELNAEALALVRAREYRHLAPEWLDHWRDPATDVDYERMLSGVAFVDRPADRNHPRLTLED